MAPFGLPLIHLLISHGTLAGPAAATNSTSCATDPGTAVAGGGLTGEAVLAVLPEALPHGLAQTAVDPGNAHEVATPDDLRRLALHMGK